jgi:hypothetical protein
VTLRAGRRDRGRRGRRRQRRRGSVDGVATTTAPARVLVGSSSTACSPRPRVTGSSSVFERRLKTSTRHRFPVAGGPHGDLAVEFTGTSPTSATPRVTTFGGTGGDREPRTVDPEPYVSIRSG